MTSVDQLTTRFLRKLPLGDKLVQYQTRAASFSEQGIQGVANVLVNIILARSLNHEGFASIGTMIGIHFFVLGMHRTAVVLPFILDATGDEPAERAAEGRWWWLNLLSVGAIAVVLLLCSVTASLLLTNDGARWFVQGLSLTVVATPALLLFEFGRRVLYQRRLSVTAMVASTLYMGSLLGVALLVTRSNPTPATASLAWVAAGLVGAAAATLAAPPGPPRLAEGFALWWANRSFAFWQAMTNIPYAIYNSSVVVPVGIFGGASAAAAYTATRTLTNPAISMVTAIDSLDKPRAARGLATNGLTGLRESVGRTRRLLALMTGSYLAVIIVFADPILHLAFGNTYANAVPEIRILSAAFFLICMNQPSETFLIVLRESKLLLVTRVIASVVALACLWLGQSYGLMGACVALLVTHVVNLSDLRVGEWVAARRWRRKNQQRTATPAPIVEAA